MKDLLDKLKFKGTTNRVFLSAIILNSIVVTVNENWCWNKSSKY